MCCNQKRMEGMKSILVIYHANCTDGFGAAYSAWRKFKEDAEYLPMAFGDPIPDVTNKEVYILDFSFSKLIYQELLLKAKSVILLDHHKPAYKNLCGCTGCFFDLNKSGTVLAWEFFHPNIPVPQFMKHIQDGDLLLFKLPDTKAFYRGIHTLPYYFQEWQLFEDQEYLDNIIQQGHIYEHFFQSQVKQIISNAKSVTLMGIPGLMVNATYIFANEIGVLLAEKCGTFGLVWYEEEHKVKCSLRGTSDCDVSKIAEHYNGGGHPNASAFLTNDLLNFSNIISS